MSTLTQYLPWDNQTLGNFKTWAQSVGTALTAFGWTLDGTVNGTVNWGTLANYPLQDPQNALPTVGTTTYQGAYSSASVSYNINDYVTFNGATWICFTAYTSSASTSPPGLEAGFGTGSAVRWRLWCFEVWKSAVAPTIFLRFEYSGQSTGADNLQPRIRIVVGTADNTSANLITTGGNVATLGLDLFPSTLNTTSVNLNVPCYFSGDSGNRFAMLFYPDLTLGGGFFCIERSLTNAGGYYTTPSAGITPYWTIIMYGYSQTAVSQAFVNTTGSTWVKTAQDTVAWTLNTGLIHNTQIEQVALSTGNGAGNVSMPAFPFYPLVGWVGNPMTAVMSAKINDVPQDGEYTIQLYGTTHTYFATRNAQFTAFGGIGAQNALVMRFD
jgi:hypothetical protein